MTDFIARSLSKVKCMWNIEVEGLDKVIDVCICKIIIIYVHSYTLYL